MAKRALCVGINDYPGTGSDLSGCVNDAEDWSAALSKRGFTVSLMIDGRATKQALVEEIGSLMADASSGDLVTITYSGHGTWVPDQDGDEPDNRDEALCPHDISEHGPLTDDDLHDLFLQRERGVRLVFVSDSCHSGSVARLAPPGEGAGNQDRVRFLPPEIFLPAEQIRGVRATMPLPKSRKRHAALLLSGCQDWEFSYDAFFGGRPNGAFSYNALNVLADLGDSASYREFFTRIREKLPSQSHPQTPNLQGSKRQKGWAVFQPRAD